MRSMRRAWATVFMVRGDVFIVRAGAASCGLIVMVVLGGCRFAVRNYDFPVVTPGGVSKKAAILFDVFAGVSPKETCGMIVEVWRDRWWLGDEERDAGGRPVKYLVSPVNVETSGCDPKRVVEKLLVGKEGGEG